MLLRENPNRPPDVSQQGLTKFGTIAPGSFLYTIGRLKGRWNMSKIYQRKQIFAFTKTDGTSHTSMPPSAYTSYSQLEHISTPNTITTPNTHTHA